MAGNIIKYTTIDDTLLNVSNGIRIFNAIGYILKLESNVYEGGIGTLTFNNSIIQFGRECFKDCSTLKTITIPETLKVFNNTSFQGCSNLISISVENGNTSFSSEDGVLFNKKGNELVYCPARKGKYFPERTIYGEGLRWCEETKEDTKTTFAFTDNAKILKTIDDGVPLATTTTIPAEYSYDTEYIVPDGVEFLNDKCFSENQNLQMIAVSKDVIGVGDESFKDCSVLNDIRFYSPQPPKLGTDVFENNPDGRKIYIQAKNITKYRFDSSWGVYDSSLFPINTRFKYEDPNYMISESDSYVDSSNQWKLTRVVTGKLRFGKLYLSDYDKG